MNLNELFFYKSIPCARNNDKHDTEACYHYHKDNNDMRRLLIDFHDVGGFVAYLIQESVVDSNSEHFQNLDKKALKLKYYTNEIGFENEMLNNMIFKSNQNICKNTIEYKYHILNYKEDKCYFEKGNMNSMFKCPHGVLCTGTHSKPQSQSQSNPEELIDPNILKFKQFYEKLINAEETTISKSEMTEIYMKIYKSENSFTNTKRYMINLEDVILMKHRERMKNTMLNMTTPQTNSSINNKSLSNTSKLKANTNANKICNVLKSNIQNELKNIPVLSRGDNYSNLINTDNQIVFLSNVSYKKEELNKLLIAFLNSHSGVIIYGADVNTNKLTGVKMDRKSRDIFRQSFNSEYKDYLINYEGCIKYKFFDLEESNNSLINLSNSSFFNTSASNLCILVIKIKKIKDHKIIFDPYNKPYVIKEKFLKKFHQNKEEKIKLNDIKHLNMKEYVEITKSKIMNYYLTNLD